MPNPTNADSDVEFFNIDQASGQITVAQELDYDAVEGRTEGQPRLASTR